MSSASAERLRRQKVLEDLNSKLTAGSKVALSITGHRIPIQGMRHDYVRATVSLHKLLVYVWEIDLQAKPSRIPTPESPARPLPSIGYVAESISLHHTPRLQNPPSDENPPLFSAQAPPLSSVQPHHTAPHTKSITVKIKGLPGTSKPFSKASLGEYGSSLTQDSVVVHSHLVKTGRGAESRKRELIRSKASTRKKYQTKPNAACGRSTSWGTAGRLNELRIRLAMHVRMSVHTYINVVEKGLMMDLPLICSYVARKYYRLWCTHVYGRVLPSDIRRHHERCLKRQAMATWRDAWWVARREWKLNIRAECHNR